MKFLCIKPTSRRGVNVIWTRQGFTMIELLAVIAVVAILAVLLVPTANKMQENAKASKSLSNLRSIGQGIAGYTADNGGRFPTKSQVGFLPPLWTSQIEAFMPPAKVQGQKSVNGAQVSMSSVYVDPLVKNGFHGTISDYGVNKLVFLDGQTGEGLPASSVTSPSKTVVALQAIYYSNRGGSWYIETAAFIASPTTNVRPDNRGRSSILAVFADGHTEAIPFKDFVDNRRRYLELDPNS